MQIKLEINQTDIVPPVSISVLANKLRKDIQRVRAGNNSQDNCSYLTAYLIKLLNHYVYFAPKPQKKPPMASSGLDLNTQILIKTEQGKEVVWRADALFTSSRLHVELPAIETEQYDLINKVINPIIDLEPNSVPKKAVEISTQDLNQILMKESMTHGGIVYGQIALAPQNLSEPGHVFVFLAEANQVIYVDAQLYNGVTKSGNPLFYSINAHYSFVGLDSVTNRGNLVLFRSRCFYLVHSHRSIMTLPSLSSSSYVAQIEDTLESIASQSPVLQTPQIQKKPNPRLNSFVDAETGVPTQLTAEALELARKNKTVILKSTYVKRQLVDAESGLPTLFKGEALVQARKNKTVISRDTYAKRQLVDAETGLPTSLTGEALVQAQEEKTVINKGAYVQTKLVDVKTGVPTQLAGEALIAAQRAKTVIPRRNYNASHQFVDAITGVLTPLMGEALKIAQTNKSVISKCAYKARHQNVDAETGTPSQLTGEPLALAKETKAVIPWQTYYRRQLVDSQTGVPTTLTGEELKLAKETKAVITRNVYYKKNAIALTQTAKTIEESARRKRNDSAEVEDIDVLDAQNQSFTHEQKKLKMTTDSCSTGLTQFGFLSRPIEVMQVEPLSSRQEDDSVTAITL